MEYTFLLAERVVCNLKNEFVDNKDLIGNYSFEKSLIYNTSFEKTNQKLYAL